MNKNVFWLALALAVSVLLNVYLFTNPKEEVKEVVKVETRTEVKYVEKTDSAPKPRLQLSPYPSDGLIVIVKIVSADPIRPCSRRVTRSSFLFLRKCTRIPYTLPTSVGTGRNWILSEYGKESSRSI